MNKVILIGNVGSDPDVSHTGSGVKYARFSLATSERWNDRNGQKQEKTTWHRCIVWDKKADLIEQYVKKGDKLGVVGKIDNTQVEDDRSGQTRFYSDVIVNEVEFLTPKGSGQRREPEPPPGYTRGGSRQQEPPRGHQSPFDSDDSDDLPF